MRISNNFAYLSNYNTKSGAQKSVNNNKNATQKKTSNTMQTAATLATSTVQSSLSTATQTATAAQSSSIYAKYDSNSISGALKNYAMMQMYKLDYLYRNATEPVDDEETIDDDTDTDYDTKVNSKIDEQVEQGASGDCWLLSGVLALNASDTGKQIIQDSITVNDDGSVTVNFKGLNKSYTISADEIKNHDTDDDYTDSYSNGDNDMLVLELATEKLTEDIYNGKITLPSEDGEYDYETLKIDEPLDNGGFPAQILYYLTGIATEDVSSGTSDDDDTFYQQLEDGLSNEQVYSILQNAKDGTDKALTFVMYYGEHSCTTTDGEEFSLELEDDYGNEYAHALAITDISDDTVTFVNPWDSEKTYTTTWEEFADMGIGLLSTTDLGELETTTNSSTESTTESGTTSSDSNQKIANLLNKIKFMGNSSVKQTQLNTKQNRPNNLNQNQEKLNSIKRFMTV